MLADNWADAPDLGFSGTIGVDNTAATYEGDEPIPLGDGFTMWGKFTAPHPGKAAVDTTASPDGPSWCGIDVWQDVDGTLLDLAFVTSSPTYQNGTVLFDVVAGTTYYVRFDSFGGPANNYVLRWAVGTLIPGGWVQPADTTTDLASQRYWQTWLATGDTLVDAPGTADAVHAAASCDEVRAGANAYQDQVRLWGTSFAPSPSADIGYASPPPGSPPDKLVAQGRIGLWAFDSFEADYAPVNDPLPWNASGVQYESPQGVPTGLGTMYVIHAYASDSSPSGGGSLGPYGGGIWRLSSSGYTVGDPTFGWNVSSWPYPYEGAQLAVLVAPPTLDSSNTQDFSWAFEGWDTSGWAVYLEEVNPLHSGVWYPPDSAGTTLDRPYIRIPYTPPRYRFVIIKPFGGIPPLRQFPRDDGLVGTGSPRQIPRLGRSVQSTIRQGWGGAYR